MIYSEYELVTSAKENHSIGRERCLSLKCPRVKQKQEVCDLICDFFFFFLVIDDDEDFSICFPSDQLRRLVQSSFLSITGATLE